MQCPQCQSEASGNFCSHCGHPLSNLPAPKSWIHETRYETLVGYSTVKNQLRHHAAKAQDIIPAEDALAVIESVTLNKIPLKALSKVANNIYAKLGIRVKKQGNLFLKDFPVGQAIVVALSYLAEHSFEMKEVIQLDNGVILEGTMPSDMSSFGGTLLITIATEEEGTNLDVATEVKGQFYDWGKSQGYIDGLFQTFKETPAETE